jgi:hypothetical protein
MTRIRFKGFSFNQLSQTGLLSESRHPSDVVQAERITAFLSSSSACTGHPGKGQTLDGEGSLGKTVVS